MDNLQKGLIRKHCRINNISYEQGENIWNSLWKFVKKSMEEGEYNTPESYKSVYIMHLGTFYPNEKHINKFKYIQQKKADENIQLQEFSCNS